ncbi:hypothetical protein FZE85_RS23995 [Escherichia coli]|nr:hypothetical protein [Escherichia coli]
MHQPGEHLIIADDIGGVTFLQNTRSSPLSVHADGGLEPSWDGSSPPARQT